MILTLVLQAVSAVGVRECKHLHSSSDVGKLRVDVGVRTDFEADENKISEFKFR
jgi:hypothetical protein